MSLLGSLSWNYAGFKEIIEIVCVTLKSSTIILCFPLLLALHTLVTLFSFQGAFWFLKPDPNTRFPSKCLNPSLEKMVGPSGLEPPTSRLSVVRSSQLSYGPVLRRFPTLRVPSKLNNVTSIHTSGLTLGHYNSLFHLLRSP